MGLKICLAIFCKQLTTATEPSTHTPSHTHPMTPYNKTLNICCYQRQIHDKNLCLIKALI